MNKKVIVIIFILAIIFMITGCSELEESGVTLESETTGTVGYGTVIEAQEKEMKNLETKHIIEFEDLRIVFRPAYSIEKSRAENWLFTQSSSINLSLGVEDISEAEDIEDIMVSQVYCDISLLSKYARYNGIRQDSLNIEYYSLPNGGVSIRKSDPYTMPFQVEGVDKSETFFYMYHGYGSSSTARITELDLANEVQGAVLNVVWTILIKETHTGNVYIKTIHDRVGIPYDRAVEVEE